jgi:tetratricopeptide (TPR) repeat protein
LLATVDSTSTPTLPSAQLDELLKGAEAKQKRDDLAGANEAFREALWLALESHDRRAEAAARRGIAGTMPGFPEALADAEVALGLDRNLRNVAGEAADLIVLSESYRVAGSVSKAQEALTAALAIERRLGLHADDARILEDLAMVQYTQGAYEEALFNFEEALKAAAGDANQLAIEVKLESELGDLNADLGRYEDAERFLKKAIASAHRLRAQTTSQAGDQVSSPRDLRMSEKALTISRDLFQQIGDPGSGGQPLQVFDEGLSDPGARRIALEWAAGSLEKLGNKMAAKADELGYITTLPMGDVTADPEFLGVWQHLVADLRTNLPAWGGVADQIVAGAASSFNHAAASHYHLKDLPNGWKVEQARQLTAMLQAAGMSAVVSEAQIEAAEPQLLSPWRAWSGQDGSPAWSEGDLQRLNRGMADGLAEQARDLRRAIAAGTIDDQTVSKVAPYAVLMLKGYSLAFQAQNDMAGGMPPDAVQASLLSFSCELNALTTLGRIYLSLGNHNEAKARNDEAWNLLARKPLYKPAKNQLAARELGMPVPDQFCGRVYGETPSTWEADVKAAGGHSEDAIHAYESVAGELRGANPAVWARMALLYAKIGQKESARDFYRKAIDASEAIQRQLRLGELTASWASHQEPIYAQAIRLLYDLGQPAEAFAYAERARARAFLNQLGNRRLPAAGVPPELATSLQTARQRLIELENLEHMSGATEPGQRSRVAGGKLESEEEDARKQYQDLLARVSRTNPEYASLLSIDTASLAQVQGEILDDRTSLVEYFVLDDQTLTWIIDRGHVKWVSLPITATALR